MKDPTAILVAELDRKAADPSWDEVRRWADPRYVPEDVAEFERPDWRPAIVVALLLVGAIIAAVAARIVRGA